LKEVSLVLEIMHYILVQCSTVHHVSIEAMQSELAQSIKMTKKQPFIFNEYDHNNNNNDRLTAFDPGQPG